MSFHHYGYRCKRCRNFSFGYYFISLLHLSPSKQNSGIKQQNSQRRYWYSFVPNVVLPSPFWKGLSKPTSFINLGEVFLVMPLRPENRPLSDEAAARKILFLVTCTYASFGLKGLFLTTAFANCDHRTGRWLTDMWISHSSLLKPCYKYVPDLFDKNCLVKKWGPSLFFSYT